MYTGSIPLWGWVIFLLVALDDVLVWLHSPYLAIPLTLIVILVIIIFFVGGKSAATNLISMAKQRATSVVASLTTKAATSMIKKDN